MVDMGIWHFNGWWDGDIHDNEIHIWLFIAKTFPNNQTLDCKV
jgi:hypothetical protein